MCDAADTLAVKDITPLEPAAVKRLVTLTHDFASNYTLGIKLKLAAHAAGAEGIQKVSACIMSDKGDVKSGLADIMSVFGDLISLSHCEPMEALSGFDPFQATFDDVFHDFCRLVYQALQKADLLPADEPDGCFGIDQAMEQSAAAWAAKVRSFEEGCQLFQRLQLLAQDCFTFLSVYLI